MMLYTQMSPIATRATLVAFFAFTDVYALIWTGHQSLLTGEVVSLGLIFLIPMVIGLSMAAFYLDVLETAVSVTWRLCC